MEKKTLAGLLAFALAVIGLIPFAAPASATPVLSPALVLVYEVKAGQTVTLSNVISSSSDVLVEWGDGSQSSWSDAIASTTNGVSGRREFSRTFTTAGSYTVTVSGRISSMGPLTSSTNPASKPFLKKVVTWSNELLSGRSLLQDFSGSSVPTTIPSVWTDVSSMFGNARVPIEVRSWDVSNIENADGLFFNAIVLMDLAPWQLTNIKTMANAEPGSYPADYSSTLRAWANNLSASQYSWSPVMTLSSRVAYCNDSATLAAVQSLTLKGWAISFISGFYTTPTVTCSGTVDAPATFSVEAGLNGGGLVTPTPQIGGPNGPSDDYYAVTFLSASGSVIATNGPTCFIRSPDTSCTVPDLPQGEYQVSITRNSPTSSPSLALSSSERITVGPAPSALPNAPTVSAIAGGVAISWDTITDATGYLIEKLPNVPISTNCTFTNNSGVTTANCTGLNQFSAYSFIVTPRNFGGSAPNPSARSLSVSPLAPPVLPSQPTGLTVLTGTDSATISWTVPSSGTAPFTYTIFSKPLILSNPSGTCVVGSQEGSVVTGRCTGLATNGSLYGFRVTATNAAGEGPSTQQVFRSTTNLLSSGSGSGSSTSSPPITPPAATGPSINKPSVDKAAPKDRLSIFGAKLDLITAIEIDGVLVSFSIQSPNRIDLTIPAGLTAGLKDLVIFSGAGKLTSQAWITIVAASDNTVVVKKLNAGSFKGFVAIYAKGYEGRQLKAKVAGKWLRVDSLASGFVRILRKTIYVNYPIKVDIYIDGKLEQKLNIITR